MKSESHLIWCKCPAILLFVISVLLTNYDLRAQDSGESYYVCWSSDISGSEDRIAYYAESREDCGKGVVTLAYESFNRMMGDRSLYQIAHSIEVSSDCPENCIYITQCLNEVDDYRPYFLLMDLNVLEEEFFNSYKKAWTYDVKTQNIISSSSFLVCRNNGYENNPRY